MGAEKSLKKVIILVYVEQAHMLNICSSNNTLLNVNHWAAHATKFHNPVPVIENLDIPKHFCVLIASSRFMWDKILLALYIYLSYYFQSQMKYIKRQLIDLVPNQQQQEHHHLHICPPFLCTSRGLRDIR